MVSTFIDSEKYLKFLGSSKHLSKKKDMSINNMNKCPSIPIHTDMCDPTEKYAKSWDS